ncbi:YfhD family protein [Aquibacillus sp. 3ASR75-11]|uniref:YfhD family protein n=1 Tax=Terrihalobacillus insolitus TaxID=2950438 RepID=A0A9X4ALG7_9BACI|nr:YfhD family protein [Terrihalobacillus insolitus]MDC3412764.1 YfhD family protein [Terrihalobacillus insolitus]MDC3423759.1 YfhD family protein [Terrihalobacillus insolitus]
MSRTRNQQTRSKNNGTDKQEITPDGRDIEFSQELADHEDLEAQERAKAADRRVKGK